jgi:hypothetical protein
MSARTAFLAVVAASATALVTPAALDDGDGGEHWAPLTPSKWAFPGDQIILTEKGTARRGGGARSSTPR